MGFLFSNQGILTVLFDPQNLKPSLYQRTIYEGGNTKTEKYTYCLMAKTFEKCITNEKMDQ
jgi:hypothetical protein